MRRVKLIDKAVLRPLNEMDLGIGHVHVRLPRTVQAALLDAKLIEDPYFRDNFEELECISSSSWEYRFKVESELGGFLVFHGVDYRCSVKVDGTEVLRHVGMFSHFKIFVGPGHHVVSVVVYPNYSDGRIIVRPPNYGVKRDFRFSMGYGWDFAPRIITLGIWDKVEFIETGGVFIDDIYVGIKGGVVGVSIDVYGAKKGDIIELFVEDAGSIIGSARYEWGSKDRYLVVPEDYDVWLPWDLGEPAVYVLRLVWRRGSDILDEATASFGFANVSFRRGKLFVNGERVFIRGANWVPMDSLLRFSASRYRDLIMRAKKAGINLLRVWGGGLREWREFYNLSDRLGILIWQEFPIACEYVEWSPKTRKIIEQEIRGIVRYLRNHPSIAVFSGGNEHPLKHHRALIKMFEKIVEELTDKPFLRGSPGGFDSHAWYVWHGLASIYTYAFEDSEIISEFGLQAIPDEEALRKFLGDLLVPDYMWSVHNFDSLKHYHYLSGGFRIGARAIVTIVLAFLSKLLSRDVPLEILKIVPTNNLIFVSQYIQALGLKFAIETCRAKGKGCILWQFNEPWPAITWSIIDYFGNKKLAYEFVAMSYSPIQVFLLPKRDKRASIIFVNDTRKTKSAEVVVRERNKVVFERNIVVPRSSRVFLGTIPIRKTKHYRTTIITSNNHLVRNYYPPYSLGLPGLIDYLVYSLTKFLERAFYQF